jgi:hypothetical protein
VRPPGSAPRRAIGLAFDRAIIRLVRLVVVVAVVSSVLTGVASAAQPPLFAVVCAYDQPEQCTGRDDDRSRTMLGRSALSLVTAVPASPRWFGVAAKGRSIGEIRAAGEKDAHHIILAEANMVHLPVPGTPGEWQGTSAAVQRGGELTGLLLGVQTRFAYPR